APCCSPSSPPAPPADRPPHDTCGTHPRGGPVLTLALLALIPLIVASGVVAAVLTAVDAAQLSVSRSVLDKALSTRPTPVRDRVLAQQEDTRSEEHTSELQSRFDLVC